VGHAGAPSLFPIGADARRRIRSSRCASLSPHPIDASLPRIKCHCLTLMVAPRDLAPIDPREYAESLVPPGNSRAGGARSFANPCTNKCYIDPTLHADNSHVFNRLKPLKPP